MGVNPRHFTLRDLWFMYQGKLKMLRMHAIQQASVLFAEDLDVVAFVHYGAYHKLRISSTNVPVPPELREKVDFLVKQAKENNGLVIVDIPDAPKREITPKRPV